MKINWQKIGFGFLNTLVLLILGIVGAEVVSAIDYTPLAPLPGVTEAAASNLPEYLVAIFKLTLGLAAVLAVIQITIGGVEYMSTDAISGKEDGKERITQAIYGLILAIGAWLILNTVNPRILTFSLNPTPIQAPQETSTTTPNTPIFETWQKTFKCVSTTRSAPDYKTSKASFSFDANNENSSRIALRQCNDFPPKTPPAIVRPLNPGECSPDYNQVQIQCERNPTNLIQGPTQ